MSARNFILLIMIILQVFACLLAYRYIKEQAARDASQNRKIERINDFVGIE